MIKLHIYQVGALDEVDIELNRINVITGPQSSGKSTVAKIISYCQWVEKRYLLDGKYEFDIEEQLLDFHRISNSYFNSNSKINYTSDFVDIKITFINNKIKEEIVSKKNEESYNKTKNIYIPSERNFVSVIPNLGRYKETNDNIMSFLYDWYSAKKRYSKDSSLPILDLNIEYYHLEDSDSDILILKKQKKEINLRDSSSGLQSLTPLTLLIDYLTEKFYKENNSKSNNEIDSVKDITNKLIEDFLSKHRQTNKKILKKDIEKEFVKIFGIAKNRIVYSQTNFIIEEPEQNLFPETQRDFIYYLFSKLNNSDRKHSVLLTTHSPYILYSINNCLMGYNISKKLDQQEKEEFKSHLAWINPDEVSLFEIKNGKLNSIKDPRTNTVTKHYFNENLNEIMNEYYEMLNYFSQI
jgi:energy-coupling factor transporter ATP-binding protein EcfA2